MSTGSPRPRSGNTRAFSLRTSIFWLHLAAGVIAGLVILVMSATGVLLAYERQVVAWADRDDRAAAPVADAKRLSVEQLLQAVVSDTPDVRPTAITLSSMPGAPALVMDGQRALAVNVYTGRVLGDASPRTRQFFRSVEDLHRWLAVGISARATGRAITDWSTVVFLCILLSGLYLWLPPVWTRTVVRARTMFRGGLSGRAREFNWHAAAGVWAVVPLLVIVTCAIPMSFPWASDLVYRAAGEEPPRPAEQAAPTRLATSGRRGRGQVPGDAFDGMNVVWARAEQQVPGWRTISLRMAPAGEPAVFTIDRGTGGQPQLRATLTLDRQSAAVMRWETFADQTPGRRLRTLARFTHTGESLGLAGQTIAAAASACATVLVATGIAMALRRLLRRRAERPTPSVVETTAA
jgi:uncharacterized iron-regulated membrane protein